jgi:hypothetical protein
VIDMGSPRTVAASSNATSCFFRFVRAFVESHSTIRATGYSPLMDSQIPDSL